MRYYSPQRMFLREAFYDRRGYVNSAFATPMVFAFNKQFGQPRRGSEIYVGPAKTSMTGKARNGCGSGGK